MGEEGGEAEGRTGEKRKLFAEAGEWSRFRQI